MIIPIDGYCDAAFKSVKQTFIENFTKDKELGAALCIYLEGKKIIDLWGGYRDKQRSRPWQKDTLVGFYSAGKPLAALCALQLVDQGLIDLDAPVCQYWPEFSASGKADITVRQLFSHQAGLPAIRKKLPEGAMLDWQMMVDALANEASWELNGFSHIYHCNTYGFLVGELVYRISGEHFKDYFSRHIAKPLAADVFFGVAEEDIPRVAELVWHPHGESPEPGVLDRPMDEKQRLLAYSYFNPSGFSSMGVMNTKEWRMGVVPSTNGHGTAQGIAKIYNVLAQGGECDGYKLISRPLLNEATRVQSEGPCPILEREVSFGLGFQVSRPDRLFGNSLKSFGHYGTGGSLGFADLDIQLGFGYVMNDVIPRWRNSRNQALVDSLYQCI